MLRLLRLKQFIKINAHSCAQHVQTLFDKKIMISLHNVEGIKNACSKKMYIETNEIFLVYDTSIQIQCDSNPKTLINFFRN